MNSTSITAGLPLGQADGSLALSRRAARAATRQAAVDGQASDRRSARRHHRPFTQSLRARWS